MSNLVHNNPAWRERTIHGMHYANIVDGHTYNPSYYANSMPHLHPSGNRMVGGSMMKVDASKLIKEMKGGFLGLNHEFINNLGNKLIKKKGKGITDSFRNAGKAISEKHAIKRIEKMMGGKLSRKQHEALGSGHPAHQRRFRKYIRALRNKTGGNIFGDIWNGLKKAHNWVKDNKVISKVGDAISSVAGKVAPILKMVHPAAGNAVEQVGNVAGQVGSVAGKHGYGGNVMGCGLVSDRMLVPRLNYIQSGVQPFVSSGLIKTY